MDNQNPHIYPPGYPPIDPQYTQYLEHLFQSQLAIAEEKFQGQLNAERLEWSERQQQNTLRESTLQKEVEELRSKLEQAEHQASVAAPTVPPAAPTVVPATPEVATPPRRSTRSTRATPNSSRQKPPARQNPETTTPSRPPKPGSKRTSTQQPGGNTTPHQPATSSQQPTTQVGYRLREQDVPEGAKNIKKALDLHLRILWGLIDANAVPPEPQARHVAAFKARFSESATEADLHRACSGEQLVDSSLVEIGSSISPATQKRIALTVKNVEESILRFVQTLISRFGLLRWCPDLNQTPYSLYNSACRIIALNTFDQAIISHAYDSLRPNTRYLTNTDLLIKLYDHFVHHRMYQVFKRELRIPGTAQALSQANPQYQSRGRLANARRNFLKQNKYPKRYLDLITPKSTSDDERDPEGTFEDKRPVFIIKRRPERSAAMERFIRLLEEKRDEAVRFGGQRRDRVRKLPAASQDTAFPSLPTGIPIDYYDPDFFNRLQPRLRKQVASETVALLPNIEDSFTKCANERLSDSAFQAKYADGVLAKYRMEDLEDIDSDEEWLDDEDLDDIIQEEYQDEMEGVEE